MRFSPAAICVVLLYAYLTVVHILYLKKPAAGVALLLLLAGGGFLMSVLNRIPARWTLESKLALVVVITIFLAVAFQHVIYFDRIDARGVSAHGFGRSIVMMLMLWFLSGAAVSRLEISESNFLAIVLLLPLFALVVPLLNDSLIISYDRLAEDGFTGANHLLVVEMILLVGFFAYALAAGRVRWLILFAVAALAYAGGGRTGFYLGVFVLFAAQFITGSRADRYNAILLGFLLLIGVGVLGSVIESDGINRMFMSSGALADDSMAARLILLQRGVGGLSDQIAIGSFASIVEANRGVGTYIHNVLSAWQFFGFINFALILVLVWRVVLGVYESFKKEKEVSVADKFGLVCLAYGVLGVLVSKHAGFSFLWFSLGFWVWRLQCLKSMERSV